MGKRRKRFRRRGNTTPAEFHARTKVFLRYMYSRISQITSRVRQVVGHVGPYSDMPAAELVRRPLGQFGQAGITAGRRLPQGVEGIAGRTHTIA